VSRCQVCTTLARTVMKSSFRSHLGPRRKLLELFIN
jgi:hypothetical protein